MAVEIKELRILLSDEAEKERRARKHATLFITLTALFGLLWLGFSVYNVIRLGRQSSALNAQILTQTTELNRLQTNINTANNQLTAVNEKLRVAIDALGEAEKVLKNIAAGNENPKEQAQRALPKVTAAARTVNVPKVEVSEMSKPPNPEKRTESPLPYAKTFRRSGFNDETGKVVYHGKDGEVINVQIHSSFQLLVGDYSLDGKVTPLNKEGSFSFSLNKAQHNPSVLTLKLGFDSSGPYSVKITTSGGGVYDVELQPMGSYYRFETFTFYVL